MTTDRTQSAHRQGPLQALARFLTGLPERRRARAAEIAARTARIDERLARQRSERETRAAAEAERERRAVDERARLQDTERVREQGRAIAEAAQQHLHALVEAALRERGAAGDERELGVGREQG